MLKLSLDNYLEQKESTWSDMFVYTIIGLLFIHFFFLFAMARSIDKPYPSDTIVYVWLFMILVLIGLMRLDFEADDRKSKIWVKKNNKWIQEQQSQRDNVH